MDEGHRAPGPAASVVIPAHNEGAVIRRTLETLSAGVAPGSFEVVVVCNGCDDDTAAQARRVGGVGVIEIPEASKALAVEAGNRAAGFFPRVHLDADVEISGADVLRLVQAVEQGACAAGPARRMQLARSSWVVRSYYSFWERLPQVRSGLFGRGVIAVSEEGQARIDALPQVMGDDLAISEAFTEEERQVVDRAAVVVHAPRTLRDLLRRRARVVTGNSQAGGLGVRRSTSVTSPGVVLAVAMHDYRSALHLPVFLAVTALARRHAKAAIRRGDFHTWLRDESSRLTEGHAHA